MLLDMIKFRRMDWAGHIALIMWVSSKFLHFEIGTAGPVSLKSVRDNSPVFDDVDGSFQSL
jgi:hypothetical protein